MTVRTSYGDEDGQIARVLQGAVQKRAVVISQDIVNESTRLLTNGTGPAGVRVRTGRLVSSVEQRVTIVGRRVRVVAGTNVVYAKWVHDGRGPVTPKTAQALRFVTPGGKVVYARSVKRARPRPFLIEGARIALAKHGVTLHVNPPAG